MTALFKITMNFTDLTYAVVQCLNEAIKWFSLGDLITAAYSEVDARIVCEIRSLYC